MMIDKIGTFEVAELRRMFYGRFPYRARLINPYESMSRHPLWNGDLATIGHWDRVTQQRHARYLKKVDSFLAEVLEEYDVADSDWMMTNTTRHLSFYFANAEAYERFLKFNGHLIADVVAPKSEDELELLTTDSASVAILSEDLFMGEYEWKIVFRKDADAQMLDDWITEVFGNNASRLFYNRENKLRTLYLADESDLCIVRLSQYDAIDRFEQIILKK